MASYRVYKIPLDNTFDRLQIEPAGQYVPSVSIISLPAASVGMLEMHIGVASDGIPLFLMGQQLNAAPPENTGIFLTNLAANAGAVLVLLIGYAVTSDQSRYQ